MSENELMTSEQFAAAVGLSRAAIFYLRPDGVLKPQTVGKRLFYTPDDVQTVKTRSEVLAQQPKAKRTELRRALSKAGDRALTERAVRALEIIAVAQVAQVVALGKVVQHELDIEELKTSVVEMLKR